MIKRKITSILLIATLAFSLFGCGGNNEKEIDNNEQLQEVEFEVDDDSIIEEGILEELRTEVTKELVGVYPKVITKTFDKAGNLVDETSSLDNEAIFGNDYDLENFDGWGKAFYDDLTNNAVDEWKLVQIGFNEKTNQVTLWGNEISDDDMLNYVLQYRVNNKEDFINYYNHKMNEDRILEFQTDVAVKDDKIDDSGVEYLTTDTDLTTDEIVTDEDAPIDNSVEYANIYDIPMYDQSDVDTRDSLMKLSYGSYASDFGILYVYGSFDEEQAGYTKNLVEYSFTPYGELNSEYGNFTVYDKRVNDQYKFEDYLTSDEGVLKVTQFGFELDGVTYHPVPTGLAYTKNPYAQFDYKNTNGNSTWIDYRRVIDGIVVEFGDYGNGTVINNIYYLLHSDFKTHEEGFTYESYLEEVDYKSELWLIIDTEGIY